jgi:two-component system OmpR family sensor kinase
MAFRSIRWRLQAWYGLILVAVLFALGLVAYQLQRGRIYHQIDDELARRVGELASAFRQPLPPEGRGGIPDNPDFRRRFPPRDEEGPPPEDEPPPSGLGPRPRPGGAPEAGEMIRRGGPFRLGPRQARLFDQGDTNGFYFVIWTRQQELARATNAPSEIARPLQTASAGPHAVTRGIHREAAVTLPSGETVLAGRSIVIEQAELRHTAWTLAGVGLLVLALGLAGGWWVSSVAIRPIRIISTTARKIAEGDLAQRINVTETESELGGLAAVLNSTFTRLENAFNEQKQFTADAAHELRTPVAVILTQTQSVLNRERSGTEYRETLEACQRAAQRMKRLIESLLELARFDAGQQPIKDAPLDLAAVATESVELVRPLAAERKVTVTSHLPPMPCRGDSDRLGQVVTNLLTNAIQYNREGGRVSITGSSTKGIAQVTIEDTGTGIPPADLPQVFKRFFRGDQSRTGGRNGLGLAISKAIVDAHGGTIEVSSQEGKGSAFTIKLPAN